ncbi:hypothetical protein GQ457_04G014520 [Hibiscus cannabinus]
MSFLTCKDTRRFISSSSFKLSVWFFEKVAQTPRKWPKSLSRRPSSVATGQCLFRHVRTPTRRSQRSLHFCWTGFLRRHPELCENGLEVIIFNNVDLSSSSLDQRKT